ncbi:MAG: hypothetical protein WA970_08310, partial [Gammaproteobacteria bacterium]
TDHAHMPRTRLPNVVCYEDLVHSHSDVLDWPQFHENTGSSLWGLVRLALQMADWLGTRRALTLAARTGPMSL